jgi:hypothetical protein
MYGKLIKQGKRSYTKLTKTVSYFVERASPYNLVNKTNLVHNLFSVYLPIPTSFGRLWAICYPHRITSTKCRNNIVVSSGDGPIVARNM